MTRPLALRCALALLLAAAFAPASPATAQTAPDEAFRTLETERFRVTFPEGMEELARRAAALAEEAHLGLRERFGRPPRGTIDVLLTDHADFAQGLALSFPSNRMVVYVPPPVDGFALSHFDEWLRLVIVHELAHLFHLDRSNRIGRLARTLFGRMPFGWPVFPNHNQPRWTIEGLATYYESALLEDAGRVHGTFHDMVLRVAALEGRLERLDQVGGRSPVWPAGERPYAYGSRFFAHLSERYGEEALEAYADAVVGQWIPFRLNAAARDAFDVPFEEAWAEWREELVAEARALMEALEVRAPITAPERLTKGGRLTLHPWPAPAGDSLLYFRADGRSDAQLRVRADDGSGGRFLFRVNGATTVSAHPSGRILFSQLEFTDPYRIRSDLYVAGGDGGARRLTRGARVSQGDLHPDGTRAVAVQEGEGSNRLVLVDVETGDVRPLGAFERDRHWAYPRWSPDGRWVAASRWSPERRFQIVLVEGESGEVRHAVPGARGMDTSPAWSADGSRLLWSSDRTGIANLFAVELDPATGRPGDPLQVTNLLGGALFPSVDPEARWIWFSSYTSDGWDLARIPYRPDEWFEPFERDPRFAADGEGRAAGGSAGGGAGEPGASPRVPAAPDVGPSRRYSPVRTLLPTYWVPLARDGAVVEGAQVVAPALGAGTSGHDLVGRHAYSAEVLVGAPEAGLQWWARAGYRWAGLGTPVLGVEVEQEHEALGPLTVEDEEEGRSVLLLPTARDRNFALSSSFPYRRVRRVGTVLLRGRVLDREIALLDEAGAPSEYRLARPSRTLLEGTLAASFSTARSHAFSVGRERGVSSSLRLRTRHEWNVPEDVQGERGHDGSFDDALGVVRAYRPFGAPGYANHVLALRLAGGAGTGPGAGPVHFRVGGSGAGRSFPVRGYAAGIRSGSRAWAGSLEYRFPLAVVHRGWRTFPLHLDRLSGGLFLDAGGAEGPDAERERGVGAVASVGAELVLEASPFWFATTPFRVGVGVPLDGTSPTVHVQLGRAF